VPRQRRRLAGFQLAEGAPRAPGSPDGCHHGCRCDDERSHRAAGSDQAAPPSPRCARRRTSRWRLVGVPVPTAADSPFCAPSSRHASCCSRGPSRCGIPHRSSTASAFERRRRRDCGTGKTGTGGACLMVCRFGRTPCKLWKSYRNHIEYLSNSNSALGST